MRKKNRKTILIFIGITLLVFVVSVVVILDILDGITSGNIELRDTNDPLEAELSKSISRYKNGELDIIDLSVMTTFSWDKFYVFGPYTSPREIDSVVGRSWRKNCFTQIQDSDGVNLLVFTDGKTVVHCLDFSMNEGVFNLTEPAFREGISPQAALFKVKNNSLLIWVSNK